MAGYKGHIVGGFVFLAAYTAAVSFTPLQKLTETAGFLHDWQALAAVFVVGVLFALFPDVDTNSKAQDIFFGIVFLLDILLIATGSIQAAAYLGFIAMLPIVSHHRGWTHRWWAILLVPLPILLVPYLYDAGLLPVAAVYYGAAVTGYFSHMFFDGYIWRWLTRKRA